MSIITKTLIINSLKDVQDPELKQSLLDLGMISDIEIDAHNNVSFVLTLTTPACPLKEFIVNECKEALKNIDSIQDINIIVSADTLKNKKNTQSTESFLGGVKNIIAISSGKGGVGKSTVALNIAIALQNSGAKVGLLDTDIYGPNIPCMLGIDGMKKNLVAEGSKDILIPFEQNGLSILSMSFFLEENQPVIWRGPMLNGIVQQFLLKTKWGELDYLIIDMPPGTGDVQLSVSQMVALAGVVIVTTAQEASLLDAQKSIAMFENMKTPILGIVENMSYFIAPDTQIEYDIFGSEQGKKISEKLKHPLLGSIPLEIETRQYADKGEPIVKANPQSKTAQALIKTAYTLAGQISIHNSKSNTQKENE